MLTTRNHRLAHAEVEVDGTVVVRARDLIVREHTSGRTKGAIEHTVLQFHFADRAAALQWLDDARAEVVAKA